MHILFVCTGNICRSPTAERLVTAYAEANLPDPTELTASSVGIHAVVGNPMEPTAEMVLSGLGGDGRNFRARQITEDQVAAADVILTMTRHHRNKVLNGSPRTLPRTFTLREAQALLSAVRVDALSDPADLTQRGRDLVAEMGRLRATRIHSARRSDDIGDPIGRDIDTFLRIGDDIAESLLPWLAVCCGVDQNAHSSV
ncbi:MAG: protein tyrosine phosphatase [Geodermatophilaceae bacterium]|nr:protein tyrosine phosphatase [Geodermatophilaceae bacterium]